MEHGATARTLVKAGKTHLGSTVRR